MDLEVVCECCGATVPVGKVYNITTRWHDFPDVGADFVSMCCACLLKAKNRAYEDSLKPPTAVNLAKTASEMKQEYGNKKHG